MCYGCCSARRSCKASSSGRHVIQVKALTPLWHRADIFEDAFDKTGSWPKAWDSRGKDGGPVSCQGVHDKFEITPIAPSSLLYGLVGGGAGEHRACEVLGNLIGVIHEPIDDRPWGMRVRRDTTGWFDYRPCLNRDYHPIESCSLGHDGERSDGFMASCFTDVELLDVQPDHLLLLRYSRGPPRRIKLPFAPTEPFILDVQARRAALKVERIYATRGRLAGEMLAIHVESPSKSCIVRLGESLEFTELTPRALPAADHKEIIYWTEIERSDQPPNVHFYHRVERQSRVISVEFLRLEERTGGLAVQAIGLVELLVRDVQKVLSMRIVRDHLIVEMVQIGKSKNDPMHSSLATFRLEDLIAVGASTIHPTDHLHLLSQAHAVGGFEDRSALELSQDGCVAMGYKDEELCEIYTRSRPSHHFTLCKKISRRFTMGRLAQPRLLARRGPWIYCTNAGDLGSAAAQPRIEAVSLSEDKSEFCDLAISSADLNDVMAATLDCHVIGDILFVHTRQRLVNSIRLARMDGKGAPLTDVDLDELLNIDPDEVTPLAIGVCAEGAGHSDVSAALLITKNCENAVCSFTLFTDTATRTIEAEHFDLPANAFSHFCFKRLAADVYLVASAVIDREGDLLWNDICVLDFEHETMTFAGADSSAECAYASGGRLTMTASPDGMELSFALPAYSEETTSLRLHHMSITGVKKEESRREYVDETCPLAGPPREVFRIGREHIVDISAATAAVRLIS